jgi:hypothetical protein
MWQTVARVFDAYANGAPRTEVTRLGLCYAIDHVYPSGWAHMGEAGRQKMCGLPRYGPTFEEERNMYWWPCTRKGAGMRVIYATLMAEVGA